jgi:hypothetical protein
MVTGAANERVKITVAAMLSAAILPLARVAEVRCAFRSEFIIAVIVSPLASPSRLDPVSPSLKG